MEIEFDTSVSNGRTALRINLLFLLSPYIFGAWFDFQMRTVTYLLVLQDFLTDNLMRSTSSLDFYWAVSFQVCSFARAMMTFCHDIRLAQEFAQ